MKTAVFQVTQGDGRARLVCVPMPSLRSAAELESWLRMHANAATEITFLGRFDSVYTAVSQHDAETLILENGSGREGVAITL
jgi:hypothetical protein